MPLLLSLALGTLISEDLTCIGAGVLIQRGTIHPLPAILACAIGILAGDIGLWAIGRLFGQVALTSTWVARRLEQRGKVLLDCYGRSPARDDTQLRIALKSHAASAILCSRFLPGTRLPLYVSAGVLRMPLMVFAWWAGAGALLWTPVLVLATAALGDAAVLRLSRSAFAAWGPALLVALMARSLGKLARSVQARCTTLTPP
jgi:membrane protein DedA with SNARE-associated domain